MYSIDWGKITGSAYYCLFSMDSANLPIDPVKNTFVDGYLRILSYQRYAKISGIDIEDLLCDDELKDGFSVLRGEERSLVLYDERSYHPRKRFTVAHEIGHHALSHTVHGGKEEIEANFFASEFLAPTAIFREIRNRGYYDSFAKIIRLMELSREAEKKKLAYLEKYVNKPEFTTIYDDYVYEKFKDYLDIHFPAKKGSLRAVWEENLRKLR